MGLKNVFGRNFWPIGQISTSEISQFEEILGKMSEYQKKVFSRSISPFKTLKSILGPKIILNGQK
jgi:hypothetical protein